MEEASKAERGWAVQRCSPGASFCSQSGRSKRSSGGERILERKVGKTMLWASEGKKAFSSVLDLGGALAPTVTKDPGAGLAIEDQGISGMRLDRQDWTILSGWEGNSLWDG